MTGSALLVIFCNVVCVPFFALNSQIKRKEFLPTPNLGEGLGLMSPLATVANIE